jgi:hypothetical protein
MCTQILVPTYTFIFGQILSYVGLSTHDGIIILDFKQVVASTVVYLLCTIVGPLYSSGGLFDRCRRCNLLSATFLILP